MFMLTCDTPALGIIEHKFTCTGNANLKVNFAFDQKHNIDIRLFETGLMYTEVACGAWAVLH